MKRLFFLSVISSLLVFSSVGKTATEEVVASIGDVKISLDEFNKKYNDVRTKSLNPPSKELFLEDFVRYKLGLIEAEKRNLKEDPVIKERLQEELYKGFIEKELSSKAGSINVTEEEMREYYKNSPELRTSHILIEVKPGASKEDRGAAKKRASEILGDVRKSKRSFEELVTLYTDDIATKPAGGDVGWQTRLTVVPSYYESALNLKVGQISDIVETEYGYHILKLTGRHSYQDATKRQIRAAVFDLKRKDLFDNLFKDLKKKYSIKTYPGKIK